MAAQAVLILTGAEGHKTVMGTLMTLYFAAAAVLLAGAFRDQAGYDPYSYDLIYYAAFSLFSLVLAGISARMTWLFISGPEIYAAAGILYSLAGAQWTFLFLSFPFLTVFSLGLCVSNTVLLKREGRSFVNTLGLLLAFCLMGGFFFLYRINMYMSGSMYEVMAREAATNLRQRLSDRPGLRCPQGRDPYASSQGQAGQGTCLQGKADVPYGKGPCLRCQRRTGSG